MTLQFILEMVEELVSSDYPPDTRMEDQSGEPSYRARRDRVLRTAETCELIMQSADLRVKNRKFEENFEDFR